MIASQTMKRISEVCTLIGGIIGIGTVILAAIQYLFNFSIFYNPTSTYLSRYSSDVAPLLARSAQFVTENSEALAKNEPETFATLIRLYVKDNKLQGQLSLAVADLEDIIACQQSYFCRLDGYERLEPTFRSIWYTYQPALLDMRGTVEKSDFAKRLEEVAVLVLEQDRNKGLTPQRDGSAPQY